MPLKKYFYLYALITLIANILVCDQASAKAVPTLTGPIMDEVGILDVRYKNKLENVLHALNDQGKLQFQIYYFDSLEDETVETYGIKLANAWKLGSKETDRGLIFLLSLRDKKMRIEVGQGLEGDITDLYSKRILSEMRPFLKAADYEGATTLILTRITEKLQIDLKDLNTLQAPRKKRAPEVSGFIIIIVLFIFLSIMQRILPTGAASGRGYRRGPFDGGGGYGGGFGGGSSGGGGWSGGGGGFSGGGASGDW